MPPALPKLPSLSGPGKQRLFLLLVAVVLGGAAVIGVRNERLRTAAEYKAKEKKLLEFYSLPVDIIVAARDIPEQTTIDPSMLKFAKVPERFAQPYSVRSPQELVGLMTVAPMAAGEQVLTNKLKRPEEVPLMDSLSSVVPKGKRAVTITVNTLTGVGGFIRPGDLVDLLWTIGLPGPDGKSSELVTMTLFQDVPVMAIKREMLGDMPPTPEGGEAPAQPNPVEEGKEYTVTLALTPQEIAFLLFAREQGRVQLSLRSQEDEGTLAAVPPVNMTTVLSAMLGADVMRASQPKPAKQVEVFKGLTRDVVILPQQDGTQ